MVVAIHLPKSAGPTALLIDCPSGEMLPVCALLKHVKVRQERNENVDMIGHDHEIGHLVAFAVEFKQRFRNDFGHRRLTQQALAVTFIEDIVPSSRESVEVFSPLVGRQVSKLGLPVLVFGVDTPS